MSAPGVRVGRRATVDGGGTEDRSTVTSTDAAPRTVVPAEVPQATTTSVARPGARSAVRAWRVKSTVGRAGSTTWKSVSASPTNTSTRATPPGVDARPETATVPLTVAPDAGWAIVTVPASGPEVGQVLGTAEAVPAAAANQRGKARAAARARRPRLRATRSGGLGGGAVGPDHYPTDPSMFSSMSRDHSTAYSMGSVRVTGSMNPLTIMLMACCSERPRLIR